MVALVAVRRWCRSGPQTVSAVNRWGPVADRCLGTEGRDERGSRPRLWRQLDCRGDGNAPRAPASDYAFCSIYPLFRRGYDPAVIGRIKGVPMKRFIGVAAGVSPPGSRRATARPESAPRPASPPPASTAARTPPASGSASDLDPRSNGEGSYGAFCRFCARQGSSYAA